MLNYIKYKIAKKKSRDILYESSEKLKEVHSELLDLLNKFDIFCRKYDIEYWLHAGTFLGSVRHKGFIPWDDDLDLAMTRENFNKLVNICMNVNDADMIFQYFNPYAKSTELYDSKYINDNVPLKVRSKTFYAKSRIDFFYNNKYKNAWIDIFVFDDLADDFHDLECLKSTNKNLDALRKTILDRNSISILKRLYSYITNLKSTKELYNKFIFRLKDKCFCNGGDRMFLSYETKDFEIYHKEDIFPLQEYDFGGLKIKGPNNYDSYLTYKYGDYMSMPAKKYRKPSHIKEL